MSFPLMPFWMPMDILRTVTLITSATSLAQTITMPAGVRAGDLAILVDALAGGNSPVVTPAGFSAHYSLMTSGSWGRNQAVSSRLIQSASEAGGTITGGVGTIDPGTGVVNTRKVLLVFRGNVPIKTATYVPGVSSGTNGDVTPLTLLSSAGTPPLVILATFSTTSHATMPLQSASPAFGGDTIIEALRVSHSIVNLGETPLDQAANMGDLGSANAHAMCYFQLEG